MAKVKWAISPYDRVLLELEDATRWIGHSELFKRCQTTFPDALEFNGVIRNLLYLQEIVGRTVPTGGRPRTEYRHAGNGFLDSPGAEDRILGILRRRGGCLTRTELLRISHIRAKDLDARITKLITDGYILEHRLAGRGRSRREYLLNTPETIQRHGPSPVDEYIKQRINEELLRRQEPSIDDEPRSAEEYDEWIRKQETP